MTDDEEEEEEEEEEEHVLLITSGEVEVSADASTDIDGSIA